jgi:ubiquitin-conjugating enzyme E2 D/E
MAAPNPRLMKEFKNMQTAHSPGIDAHPINNDLYHWEGIVQGPAGTPYEGGIFKLDIEIPPQYPHKPPVVKFTTKIYHPNVDPEGKACLPILAKDWAPAITIDKILVAIARLLAEPEPDHAVQAEIGVQFMSDRAAFDREVKKHVQQYAH